LVQGFESQGRRSISAAERAELTKGWQELQPQVEELIRTSQPIAPRSPRPTWQQSQEQLGALFEEAGYRPQVPFKQGKEVNPFTEDSVRPEFYKSGESVEVKNFNLETAHGRRNLIQRTTEQAIKRVTHLPPGTVQKVIIDIRGQNVPLEVRRQVIADLVEKSGGALTTDSITFLID
jgi:hypothetical protein